jgi:hypothetical protein
MLGERRVCARSRAALRSLWRAGFHVGLLVVCAKLVINGGRKFPETSMAIRTVVAVGSVLHCTRLCRMLPFAHGCRHCVAGP